MTEAQMALAGDYILGLLEGEALCSDPADGMQFVLQSQNDLFASDAWEYFLARFFHRGLMLLDFDEHRLHRRVMLVV